MTTTTMRQMRIDFLFLDLDTCTRCRATDTNLIEARWGFVRLGNPLAQPLLADRWQSIGAKGNGRAPRA